MTTPTTNPGAAKAPDPIEADPTAVTPITSWRPPDWADAVSTDGDQIEASHIFGTIPRQAPPGHDSVTVLLLQRDALDTDPSSIVVQRHPAVILVGGVTLPLPQVRELARLLDAAVALIEAHTP